MASEQSSAPAPAQSTGTVEDAARSIEALLSGTPEKQPKPAKPQAVSETADSEETPAEDLTAEETPVLDEENPEADEAEEPTDAPEEGEDSDKPEPTLYTVKIDGKEEKVPLDELLNGYSRTADYTRKTEALANERRSFSGEIEQVRTERAQYAQLLPALAMQLESSLPPAPDPALRETDPLEYVLQKDRHEEAVGKLGAAFSELQRVQQVQQGEQTQQLQAYIAEGQKKLPELIPAWKDPKAYERDKPKLREYLQKTGYSAEEVNRAYDPRAVAMAWKAMRYDELLARKPRPDTPLAKALPTTPAPVPRSATQSRDAKVARNRLKETGQVEDAAKAIRALL